MPILDTLQRWLQRLTPESAAGPKLDPAQRKDLLAALASERAADRWLAAEALAEGNPGREGVVALAGLLGDPDPLLRSEAAHGLGQIGGKAARQALLEAAASGGALAQAAAADGLRALPATPETVAALAGLVESTHVSVRQSAVEALARLDPLPPARAGATVAPAIQARLLHLLDTDDAPMVRRAAVLALGRWGDTAVDGALAARQDDPDESPLVRDTAALALSRPRLAASIPEPLMAETSGAEATTEQADEEPPSTAPDDKAGRSE